MCCPSVQTCDDGSDVPPDDVDSESGVDAPDSDDGLCVDPLGDDGAVTKPGSASLSESYRFSDAAVTSLATSTTRTRTCRSRTTTGDASVTLIMERIRKSRANFLSRRIFVGSCNVD